MANLGTLAVKNTKIASIQKTDVWWSSASNNPSTPGGSVSTKCVSAKVVPIEFGALENVLSVDISGVLSGQVLGGTTPIAGAEVWVFHRGTKLPVVRTTSASNGGFSVSGLGKVSGAYFAVAFGPDGTSYGASIFDTLTPV